MNKMLLILSLLLATSAAQASVACSAPGDQDFAICRDAHHEGSCSDNFREIGDCCKAIFDAQGAGTCVWQEYMQCIGDNARLFNICSPPVQQGQ